MTPTRPSALLGLAAAGAVLAFLLVRLAYGALPPLPGFAPVPVALLGLAELVLARAVARRLRGAPVRGRALHPLQVARAAVLGKASAAAGALVLGVYAGGLAHLLALDLPQARRDAVVSGATLGAALLLVAAGLLLERACRAPGPPRG